MSIYTKHVEQYMYTETVIRKDGEEIYREANDNAYWYDTEYSETITEEEAEDYL
jgi:hypothetical protein